MKVRFVYKSVRKSLDEDDDELDDINVRSFSFAARSDKEVVSSSSFS
jgi:hypothetical protein